MLKSVSISDGTDVAKPAVQDRSKKTTRNIVLALEELLKQKAFEQITVSEIANGAGISPGAIYKRFDNKEALLPYIFLRYQQELTAWIERVSVENVLTGSPSLLAALKIVTSETLKCFRDHDHIFRTVHLYGRLHPELASQIETAKTNAEFEPIAGILKNFASEIGKSPKMAAAFIGHTLIANCIERAQYPNQLPAAGLKLSDKKFTEELAEMFALWLIGSERIPKKTDKN